MTRSFDNVVDRLDAEWPLLRVPDRKTVDPGRNAAGVHGGAVAAGSGSAATGKGGRGASTVRRR